MNRFFSYAILLALLLFSSCSREGAAPGQKGVSPYFAAEELPDLIQCLPAPPDSLDALYAYDVLRYQWGKTLRSDSIRMAVAVRDAGWTYEELLAEFDEPFGMHISAGDTPQIWKLLETSLVTTDQMRVAPKAYFHRIRPFEFFGEETATGEDDFLRGEGSYPSGHTMRGWAVAMMLSEVNPAAANALYARGWMYGESRVIAGAHWQSDVDASRVAASIAVAALHTSRQFRRQLARAKREFRRGTAR